MLIQHKNGTTKAAIFRTDLTVGGTERGERINLAANEKSHASLHGFIRLDMNYNIFTHFVNALVIQIIGRDIDFDRAVYSYVDAPYPIGTLHL